MILFRSRIPVLACGAALLLAGSSAARGAAEKVTFHFAPPLGKTYLATSKVTTAIATPRGKVRVLETEIASRLRTDRAGQQIQQTFSVISAVNKLDGSPMDSPLTQVLPGLDVTFALGADGQIVDLVNFAGLLDRVRKSIPPERFEAVTPFFTAEALLARRRAAADPLVSALAGKTLAVGETTTGNGTVTLPTGDAFPVRLSVTLKGRERTSACDCLRIDFTTQPILQSGKPADVGATGQGTALIDPATLLTWSLRHEQQIVKQEPGAPQLQKITLTVEDSLAPGR